MEISFTIMLFQLLQFFLLSQTTQDSKTWKADDDFVKAINFQPEENIIITGLL